MVETLDEIKGVGEKVKEALISYYGSEAETLRSLETQEFERLLAAGIPFQKAVEIARYVTSKKYGFSYANIMKTREAKELFNRIFETLSAYPRTDFGRIGVGLFYPSLNKKEIEKRFEHVKECAELARGVEEKREELDLLLSKITPLKEEQPKIGGIIAVEDTEVYEELTRRFQKSGQFILIEKVEDLEYLRDFEFVRYLQRNSRFSTQAMELPHIEPVFEDDVESLVPEAVLSFFGTNKECILSAISIAKLCDDQRSKEIALELQADIEAIKSTEGDGLSRGGDKELERMELALESLEEAAQSCLDDANAEISEGIGSMSLKGEEVLTMLKTAGTSTLLASLPKEFFDLILTTARKFEDAVAEKLEIDKGWIRGLFSTDTHPLMIDAERLSEIKVQLAAEKNRAEFDAKRRIAKRLSKHIPLVKTLVRKTMELDLRLALGEFVIDYKLTQPQLQEELGLGFRKGRNLRLKEKVQPVDYVIGSSDLFPGRKERAVVITGANSGGKTTLLELVAQVVLMAHMGLGAPADVAKTSLFDEVYYFGKGQGDDAGAFETLLKTFEGLTRSSRRKIILTDELEAITEPGAAAKILAALLEWFKEDKSTIIAVVTHLGEDIKEHVNEEVRIDGIQATGLDEEFNLVVDRNPVLGKVARSTPELIVERLSRISSKKGFYNRILDRFR